METIYLVNTDTKAQIQVVLKRINTGLVESLTGKTTWLKLRKRNSTTVLFTIEGQYITDEARALGETVFAFGNNLIDIDAGQYLAEVSVTDIDGTEVPYDTIPIQIRDGF